MKIIFISDLHLSPDTPEKNQLFYELLTKWQGNIDALYILGDFFDYWLGDDDRNPFVCEMEQHLAEFAATTRVYFRGGNHDFALGKKFARKCKITLIPDLYTINLNGNITLLSHGDTFCTLDTGYQKMKRILQNPVMIFLLKLLPLAWRYKIKEQLEQKSHTTPNGKPDYIYCVVNESIVDFALEKGASWVIHGHTHRPGIFTIANSKIPQLTRFEIPDWQDNPAGGYLLFDGEKIEIVAAQ